MPELSRNNGSETGFCRPPVAHQFKVGNPGRPKGSRNKLGEDFVAALAEDFAANGKQAIETVRTEKPDAYLKVIAAVVPKEVHHRVEDYDDLSEAEIESRITALLASAGGAGGSRKTGRGASEEARAQGSPAQLPN